MAARLKKFIFGSGSEKTEAIMASLGQDGKAASSEGKPGSENASGEGDGFRHPLRDDVPREKYDQRPATALRVDYSLRVVLPRVF